MSINIQKIDWKANKKSSELVFARFFIERLNQNHNFNYHVIPDNEDTNDVDIQAITKGRRTLNLQLKTGEPGLEQFLGSRRKHGSGAAVIDGNIENGLSQIIKDGEQHYSDRANLVFLITGRFLFDCDKTFAQYLSSKLVNSTFMGVYLVRFHAGFNIRPPLEDYVVAIKGIFGKHGQTF